MSEAIETGLAASSRRSRKDWQARIASASIPEETKSLITSVVRRTRLWKWEKHAVAGELIAHFGDAIDAGVSAEEAIRRFGDVKQAARLIRRAMIRKRSIAWHLWKWIRRAVLTLALLYIGAGIYYAMGKPSPSVDYIAKLNARVYSAPIDDRAWPLYRPVVASFRVDPMPDAIKPADEKWADALAWLDRHEADLAALRIAAAKPILGRLHGLNIDAEDAAAFNLYIGGKRDDSILAQSVIGVLLPQLNYMRQFATALAADAARAAEAGDAARFEQDILAILGISRQLRKNDVFVTDLVSVGCQALAVRVLGDALHRYPALLGDDALVRLSHQFAGQRVAGDLISYEAERYVFYDVAQRIYTDNGHGDGRMTPKGMEFLAQCAQNVNVGTAKQSYHEPALSYSLGPAAMLMMASRKEMLHEYDFYLDAQQAQLAIPLRDVVNDEPEARIQELKNNLTTAIKYSLVTTLAPGLSRSSRSAEQLLGQQEGLTVAMALELYKRSQGGYPASLNDLVPRYLPAVPADRIDGRPIRYRLVEGKPVVYSVGVDRDDDGGQPPMKNGEPRNSTAAEWGKTAKVVDGDWVLFPQP